MPVYHGRQGTRRDRSDDDDVDGAVRPLVLTSGAGLRRVVVSHRTGFAKIETEARLDATQRGVAWHGAARLAPLGSAPSHSWLPCIATKLYFALPRFHLQPPSARGSCRRATMCSSLQGATYRTSCDAYLRRVFKTTSCPRYGALKKSRPAEKCCVALLIHGTRCCEGSKRYLLISCYKLGNLENLSAWLYSSHRFDRVQLSKIFKSLHLMTRH